MFGAFRGTNKIETGKRPTADSNRMDRIDRIKKSDQSFR
jgi:hypothetical protein